MKSRILLFAVLCASCTKKPCAPITVPVYQNTTLLGSWSRPGHSLVIGKTSVIADGTAPYQYLASPDTLYLYHDDMSVSPLYGYTISKSNDTLKLYPTLNHPDAPFVYVRTN